MPVLVFFHRFFSSPIYGKSSLSPMFIDRYQQLLTVDASDDGQVRRMNHTMAPIYAMNSSHRSPKSNQHDGRGFRRVKNRKRANSKNQSVLNR
jgi:hypothetical protein